MKKVNIYEELKDRIIKIKYKPGDLLNEVEIAKEFEISRTPVRNAFQRLELDNLIKIIPRFGVQVSFIDLTNVKSLFELTKVLDPMATKLASKKLTSEQIQELKHIIETLKDYSDKKYYQEAIIYDEKFHQIIIQNCGNPWLIDTLNTLHIHTERLWHYCYEYFQDMSVFTKTFEKIVIAIETNDEISVEKASIEHIEDFTSYIKEALF